MTDYKVTFDAMEWQAGPPGVRFKIHREGDKQIRLLEFSTEFVEADWCQTGHIGIVLEGELEIDFHDRTVRYPKGSGIFIPAGAPNAHKARARTALVRVFVVEDFR